MVFWDIRLCLWYYNIHSIYMTVLTLTFSHHRCKEMQIIYTKNFLKARFHFYRKWTKNLFNCVSLNSYLHCSSSSRPVLHPKSFFTARGPSPVIQRFMHKTYQCKCQVKFRCILFHRYICRIRGCSDTPGWSHYTGYRWHIRQCLRHTWSLPIRSYTDTPEPCHTLRLRARSYKASYILVRNDVHHTL